MNILQLTDLHVNAEGRRAFLRAESLRDLRRTVDYILGVDLQIDAVVVTGDVSTDGTTSAYELARRELLRLGCPFWVLPGNHDKKAEMKAVFADRCHTALDGVSGFCIDTDEVRLLLFDTAAEGVSAGGMNQARLDWLAEHLNVPPQRPIMLWMHHFPFRSGYQGMDHPFEGEKRLLELLIIACRLSACKMRRAKRTAPPSLPIHCKNTPEPLRTNGSGVLFRLRIKFCGKGCDFPLRNPAIPSPPRLSSRALALEL